MKCMLLLYNTFSSLESVYAEDRQRTPFRAPYGRREIPGGKQYLDRPRVTVLAETASIQKPDQPLSRPYQDVRGPSAAVMNSRRSCNFAFRMVVTDCRCVCKLFAKIMASIHQNQIRREGFSQEETCDCQHRALLML